MKVGFTYDLRSAYLAEGYSDLETAEFDRDDTIDEIESALLGLGHEVVRIGHARHLMRRLVAGERWDLVFNICEGLGGAARESQVPGILDVHGIAYTFSDAGVLALSLNKAWTKSIVAAAGVPVAPHLVVESLRDLDLLQLAPPLFLKPLAEGTGKGVTAGSVIRNRADLPARCTELLAQFRQPVLVEAYLPGREFTVGLLGTGDDTRVLGTFEVILRDSAEPGAYGYLNKEECETRVEYRLVHAAEDPLVREAERISELAWQVLGCRDAGRVDLRVDGNGVPCFIEVNPLAGLHPLHSDLPMLATAVGLEYGQLIEAIMESATTRVRKAPAPRGR